MIIIYCLFFDSLIELLSFFFFFNYRTIHHHTNSKSAFLTLKGEPLDSSGHTSGLFASPQSFRHVRLKRRKKKRENQQTAGGLPVRGGVNGQPCRSPNTEPRLSVAIRLLQAPGPALGEPPPCRVSQPHSSPRARRPPAGVTHLAA